MGAWGSGNFENDDALDWLGGFDFQPRLTRLNPPLRQGLVAGNSSGDWQEALAAAEIIALIRGYPSNDCPEHLLIWAQQKQSNIDPKLVALAKHFVSHVVDQVETADFVAANSDREALHDYRKVQKGLLRRLTASPRKLPQVGGQVGSTEPRKEPWVDLGYIRFTKEPSPSTKRDFQRLAIVDLPEKANIPFRSGWRSSIEIHLDFLFKPAEIERLVRLIQKNAEHRIRLVRLNGGTYFKNRELTPFLNRVAPHLQYLSSMISGVDLAPLAKASRLSKLSLYFDKKLKGDDLQYLKGLSELEILYIGRTVRLPSGDIFSRNSKLKYLVITAEELENNRLPELPPSLEELSLDISHTTSTTDISAISRLPKLRRLGMSVDQFRPLPNAGFQSLEFAQIDSSISDCGFLAGAKSLRDFRPPPLIADLDFLRGLSELRRLNLGGLYNRPLAVTDLTPLEELPRLSTFHLSHSDKIDRLPRLRHLERFECFRVPKVNLEEIRNFPALRQFSRMSPDLSDGIIEKLKVIAPPG